jgi:hypothetical protein
MTDLFGCNWEDYYFWYTDYFKSNIHGNMSSQSDDPMSNTLKGVKGVWGATFGLDFPYDSAQIDGYAALMALRTLNAIESAITSNSTSF